MEKKAVWHGADSERLSNMLMCSFHTYMCMLIFLSTAFARHHYQIVFSFFF